MWAIEQGFKTEIIKAVPVTMETKAVVDIRLSVDVSPVVITTSWGDGKFRGEPGGEIYGMVMDANGVVPARITATELAAGNATRLRQIKMDGITLMIFPQGTTVQSLKRAGPRYGALVPEYETQPGGARGLDRQRGAQRNSAGNTGNSCSLLGDLCCERCT